MQSLSSNEVQPRHTEPDWVRIPIARIEDLRDAVLGAGLDAAQLSRTPVTGGLVFGYRDGITCSSGLINGRVALRGPLSESMVTFGVGLRLAPGTRHWLTDVQSGDVGLFLPGDEHDALYTPGSMYAAITLDRERIEAVAAQFDLVLDPYKLGGTGVDGRRFPSASLAALQEEFYNIHTGQGPEGSQSFLGLRLLNAFVQHFGREPHGHVGKPNPKVPMRIVARARSFIYDNISQPLSIETIAAASFTSPRSLHRAFQQTLGETPYSYVVKVRLNRIRSHILSDTELSCSIAAIANECGMSELGRLAASYDELFGELPSETRKRCQELLTSPNELAAFA